jgi:endonuclease-3
VPAVTVVSVRKNPFLVLVSCILSLRTQDATTAAAGNRLFARALTPQAMARLSVAQISRLIYPVGFYRTKAVTLHRLCVRLIKEFKGEVPASGEALLSFQGVGRKTANLVLGLGFKIPAICVDTHVHRISNRLGWVRTRTPEETEYALQRVLPKRWWIGVNTVLVTFGQHICQPVSPWCTRCAVKAWCPRKGVLRSR